MTYIHITVVIRLQNAQKNMHLTPQMHCIPRCQTPSKHRRTSKQILLDILAINYSGPDLSIQKATIANSKSAIEFRASADAFRADLFQREVMAGAGASDAV